jgi:hypothetical protein
MMELKKVCNISEDYLKIISVLFVVYFVLDRDLKLVWKILKFHLIFTTQMDKGAYLDYRL